MRDGNRDEGLDSRTSLDVRDGGRMLIAEEGHAQLSPSSHAGAAEGPAAELVLEIEAVPVARARRPPTHKYI